MDGEHNRRTDQCKEIPDKISTEVPAEPQTEKLARTINDLIGLTAVWLAGKDGAAVISRLELLSSAIGQGGMLPDSGLYSHPWLAFFLNRQVPAIEKQAEAKANMPTYRPTKQPMHRAEDWMRNSIQGDQQPPI